MNTLPLELVQKVASYLPYMRSRLALANAGQGRLRLALGPWDVEDFCASERAVWHGLKMISSRPNNNYCIPLVVEYATECSSPTITVHPTDWGVCVQVWDTDRAHTYFLEVVSFEPSSLKHAFLILIAYGWVQTVKVFDETVYEVDSDEDTPIEEEIDDKLPYRHMYDKPCTLQQVWDCVNS